MLEALVKTREMPSNHFTDFNRRFLGDVLTGLTQANKVLSPKYFYDTAGSHFFDQICGLKEYYPYRTELALLPEVAEALNRRFARGTAIVEFGAGSLQKIQPLLDKMEQIRRFLPIDIAGDFLNASCKKLQQTYPHIDIHPVTADFCLQVDLPDISQHTRLGFFPGSTIGNFTPSEAITFLLNAGKTLGPNNHLLVGVDTKKSPIILHNAYNDSEQITAKFNLNILTRINTELGANFDLDQFEHYAFYNAGKGRIEMHLVSKIKQNIAIGNRTIAFEQGESIHTESSYKYNREEFGKLAQQAHWRTEQSWLSPDGFFSMHLLCNTCKE